MARRRYLAIACLLQLLLMSHWWAWHGVPQ
jgi:hypothetical protein